MNTLQNVLAKTLEKQGIYSILDVRPGTIKDFGKILIFAWVIVNIPALTVSGFVWLWFGSILIALALEQSIYTIRKLGSQKKIRFQDIISTITLREPDQRFNFWSVFVYFLMRHAVPILLEENHLINYTGLLSTPSQLLDLLFIIFVANPLLLLMGIKTSALFEYSLLSARLAYTRTIRIIRIAISSNLRFSIPAVVLISIIGIVSSEIWRFFNLLSWRQLFLAIFIFLIPIMFASQKRIVSKIEKRVMDEADRFDTDSLEPLKRSLRVMAGIDCFSIPQIEFERYQKNARWKWRENVLYKISKGLIRDLKTKALGIYQLTLVSFIPGFFLFILTSAIILFSREFLAEFLPQQLTVNILSLSSSQPILEWLNNVFHNYMQIPQDVLFKYSAVSTFFLVGQFMIAYPENEQVFDESEINQVPISDWLNLMYAYEISKEDGYFYVNIPFSFADLDNPYFWLTLYAVPDNVEKGSTATIAEKLVEKDLSLLSDRTNSSLLIMKSAALTKTDLFKELNIFYRFRNISSAIAESADTQTLIYLGKKYSENAGTHYFDTFEDAKMWYLQMVVPPAYKARGVK